MSPKRASDYVGLKAKVLDKGFVEVLGVMEYDNNPDLVPVNAARVSFDGASEKLSKRDVKLLHYLAKNRHDSPFRHQQVALLVKWPEFVARQAYKHVVGIDATSECHFKDHAWNEISGRYVELDDIYHPENWRAQSESSKQASEGSIEYQNAAHGTYDNAIVKLKEAYRTLLELGVAKEQARILLPMSFYTQVRWTTSFQALAHFCLLRDHPHAQWEIREYAKVFRGILDKIYPETTRAWFEERGL